MEAARTRPDDGAMADGEGAARPGGLVRRMDDRFVAGVCSGLADRFGVDPILFRVGFVAAAALGGAGLVVYLAAWALIPASDRPAGGGIHRGLALAALAGVALVAIPLLVEVLNVGFPPGPGTYGRFDFETLVIAGGLVLTGLALLASRRERFQTEGAMPLVRAPRAARPPRERSGLVPITLAVVLLVGAAAAAGASAGWAPLDVGQLAALSLLLVGTGLIVGAWFGRARLLIAVGLLMVPVVLVTSLIDFPPTGTIGSSYVDLERAGELENMRVLAGQVTLDLADYPFEEGREEARLRVAAGSMTVIVPHDVRVDASVTVEAGEAHVFRGFDSGLGIVVEHSAGPEDAVKKLDLEVVAGIGSVGIYRMKEPDPARERDDRRGRDRPRPDRRGGKRDGRKR